MKKSNIEIRAVFYVQVSSISIYVQFLICALPKCKNERLSVGLSATGFSCLQNRSNFSTQYSNFSKYWKGFTDCSKQAKKVAKRSAVIFFRTVEQWVLIPLCTYQKFRKPLAPKFDRYLLYGNGFFLGVNVKTTIWEQKVFNLFFELKNP